MAREDTFAADRAHLAGLSDAELEALFWQLAREVVDPLVELARTHTSPSIERSVLMRMGVDSPTCTAVVGRVREARPAGARRRACRLVLRRPRGASPCGRPPAAGAAGDGWEAVAAEVGRAR